MSDYNKIILKKSGTIGSSPDAADLDYGEIAINYMDGKIFYKNPNNIVQSIVPPQLDVNALSSIIVGITNTSSSITSSAFGYNNVVTGSNSSAIGYKVKVNVDNVQSLGYWSNSATRGGEVRIHGTGMVQQTVQDHPGLYTDGGITAGSEADGTLGRNMLALRANGNSINIDYNIGGVIKTCSLGVYSNNNTGFGIGALTSNTTGDNNVAIGYNALTSNTTGDYNIATGDSSLASNTTGNFNVATGDSSLASNTTGDYNIATGANALSSNTIGNYNIATSASALSSNTIGNYNIATGANALGSNTTGNNNVATGGGALGSNTTGHDNIAIGSVALFNNTIGNNNIATGTGSLYANTEGYSNIATGDSALYSNTSGYNNIATGDSSLYANTTGNTNIATGVQSLFSNTTGSNNIATGVQSLFSNTTGSNNIAYGLSAGMKAGTIFSSGPSLTSVNNSVYIGAQTRASAATGVTNETVVGYDAYGAGSNTATIGNTSNIKVVLNGVVKSSVYTMVNLPAASGLAGARTFVTNSSQDLNMVQLGAVLITGTTGPYTIPVWCDGTDWRVG